MSHDSESCWRRRAAGAVREGSFVLVVMTALAVMGASTLRAQTAGASDVIDAAGLTAGRVLDALDPSAVRARSFKLGSGGKGVTTGPARASASLLITFETNSAELTSAARRQLDVIAEALKNDRLANYGFIVEGHADPRGGPDTNLQLSQDRADSVKQYLMTQHAIGEARLVAEGRGDREPLNRASPAAPENRRVTFVTRP